MGYLCTYLLKYSDLSNNKVISRQIIPLAYDDIMIQTPNIQRIDRHITHNTQNRQ